MLISRRVPFYFHETLPVASMCFDSRRGFCAKVKKLLVADLSKRFGNLKVRMMGGKQKIQLRFVGVGEVFIPRFGLFLADFQFVKIIFWLYQVGTKI